MRLDRRRFVAGLAGTLALPALPRSAFAAPQRLTVASLLAEDKPETQIWRRIGEMVEARLPGRFTFNVVPNAALGGERQVAEGLRLGSVQASLSTLASLSAWSTRTQLFDLPFLFDDAAHLARVTGGPIGAALAEELRGQGFVTPAFVNYGARHLLSKTPIARPDALRGLRIRAIQSPVHTTLWSAYGAAPVAIPIPETYGALESGVVDAMDLTKSAYAGFRLYEVVPFLTETAHIWAAGVVNFAAPFWSGLTEEEQTVLTEASVEGARLFDAMIVEDETRAMAEAAAAGGSVVQPEAMEAWRAGAQTVWTTLADAVGGQAAIDAVRDLADA